MRLCLQVVSTMYLKNVRYPSAMRCLLDCTGVPVFMDLHGSPHVLAHETRWITASWWLRVSIVTREGDDECSIVDPQKLDRSVQCEHREKFSLKVNKHPLLYTTPSVKIAGAQMIEQSLMKYWVVWYVKRLIPVEIKVKNCFCCSQERTGSNIDA